MSPSLSPPEPLADGHKLDAFASGEASLDEWLRRRARASQAGGASRTYIVCEGEKVVAYYVLAFGAISQAAVRRNMREPIPWLSSPAWW